MNLHATDPFLPTYRRHPVTFVRGEGVWLTDADGKRYLDFLGGIAVCSLGHAHPALVGALREQAGMLLHVSNLFTTPIGIRAAELLRRRLGGGRVFLCNSGAEAVEAGIKLARKRAWRRGEPHRTKIVCLEGSFHGRTYGALAATIQPAKWVGFGPLPPGFVSVPPDDVGGLERIVGDETAAILFEPILGEGGIRPVSPAFAQTAQRLASDHGALLICDEVQTGVGRTGRWWGHEHLDIRPDVVALAKGLGGGFPVGAMWCAEEHADALQPGDHATTFGGNALASAAVACVLETVERDGLVDHARRVGDRLREAVSSLGTQVRGAGLLLGLDLGRQVAADVVTAALGKGLVVNDVSPTTIRLAPPLVVTEDEADEAAARLRDAIEEVT